MKSAIQSHSPKRRITFTASTIRLSRTRDSSNHHMSLLWLLGKCVCVASWLVVSMTVVSGQQPSQVPELSLNQSLERELTKGQTHEYQVTLTAGEFMQVRAEQKGIDVVLSIRSRDGAELAMMDSPNGSEGFEIISLIADKAGRYVVRINRLNEEANADSGKFSITLTAKRPATAQDRKRIEAERQIVVIFPIDPGKPEQFPSKLEQYKAVLPQWRELKDVYVVELLEKTIASLENAITVAEREARRQAAAERRKERDLANINVPQLTIPIAHSMSIWAVAYSSDGRMLASGSMDNTVKLWDVASGRELKTLGGHTREVRSLVFSPDGKTLASGSSDGTIMLWDVATGIESKTLRGHTDSIFLVTFSPDGSILASACEDKTIKLWDAGSGNVLKTLKGHADYVYSVAFSPDGKTLASAGGDKTIRLWDVASGRELNVFEESESIYRIAFSPDGKSLASVTSSRNDKTIRLRDVISGKTLETFEGHTDEINAIGFSPDGTTLASASNDHTVRLWDVASRRELKVLKGHTGKVHAIAFSSDGKTLASGGDDVTVRLWDVASGNELKIFNGISAGISAVIFSPDGKLMATQGYDKTVVLWDTTTGRAIKTFKHINSSISPAAFSPDDRVFALGTEDAIKLWDLATSQELKILNNNLAFVSAVAFSPDGKTLVAASLDNVVLERIMKLTGLTKETVRILEELALKVQTQSFNLEDGKLVPTPPAEDKLGHIVTLWDVSSWRPLRTLKGSASSVMSFAFTQDSRTLGAGDHDGTIKIWYLPSGRELITPVATGATIKLLAFSPDGKNLVARSSGGRVATSFPEDNYDEEVKLWDVASGKEVKYTAPPNWVEEARYNFTSTPTAKKVRADNYRNKIILYDAATEDQLATVVALDENTWAVLDSEGHWDASDEAQKLMYNVLPTSEGYEIIEFSQLKERYYEPNLLPKLLGYNKEMLRDVAKFKDVLLPPAVELMSTNDPRSTLQQVRLKNRNGGIGRVQVFVNGREVIEDARDEKLKADPNLKEYVLTFDLKDAATIPGEEPDVRVVAWNYDEKAKERYKGYISSRGARVVYLPPEEKAEPPTLYAIIGGVSDYKGNSLHLNFAAKDAEDMFQAVRVGGKNLFGAERTKLVLLSTGVNKEAIPPTKDNFRKAFDTFARDAKPGDILFVYLSGHGITLNSGSDTYYYLTQEASTNDKDILGKDSKLLENTTINSEELTQWHKRIKAQKQLLILDTCAAGALSSEFKIAERRELSSDAKRAIENMRTRIGFHVLMGSAADAVSYEASQYGQGLLTYSLLQGMTGPALKSDGLVDVSTLFNYAVDTVPTLAENIGGIQRPEIRVPIGGASFPFGLIKTNDDKSHIPLARLRPMILRPSFQNQKLGYDNLRIANSLRDDLREVSRAVSAGNVSARLIFVDIDEEMPGAILPTGNYVIQGERVKVTMNLLVNDRPAMTVTFKGTIKDLSALRGKMLAAIVSESQKLNATKP